MSEIDMTPYEDTVDRMAMRVFHNYMSGSYEIWRNVPTDDIAFIYNIKPHFVNNDIEEAYKRLLKAQYETPHKT